MPPKVRNKEQETEREELENATARLAGAQLPLDMIDLRVQQAIQRANLDDLLEPVLGETRNVRARVESVQTYLSSRLSNLENGDADEPTPE